MANNRFGIITDGRIWEVYQIEKKDPTIRVGRKKRTYSNMKYRKIFHIRFDYKEDDQIDPLYIEFAKSLSPRRILDFLESLAVTFGDLGYAKVMRKYMQKLESGSSFNEVFGHEFTKEDENFLVSAINAYAELSQDANSLDGKWK